MALFAEGKLFREAGTGTGGDKHNKGYFVDETALTTAYPIGEAGDYAIVESTDTVWVWDSDNSEWKDSDQKGQVTSVNNQTGDVALTASDVGAATTAQGAKADTAVQPADLATVATTGDYDDLLNKPTIPSAQVNSDWNANSGVAEILNKPTIPEAVQYSTMPTASADNLGDIIQFTGTTDANYTNGYFYQCVSDGQDPATYSWTRVDVQPAPSGLPDQTGQNGKFLTTDGTDASWSDKPLVNVATGSNSITIGGTATASGNAVNIGAGSSTTGGQSVVVGQGAYASANATVVIGQVASASGQEGIAIGNGASAAGGSAIQLGYGTNSTANTFKIRNYELMSADGTVPHGRLTNAVVSNAVTIAAADWNGGTTCTKTISGLTATSVVWVAPDSASQSDYLTAGVYASAQTTDTITFTATTTPTSALTVNVIYC